MNIVLRSGISSSARKSCANFEHYAFERNDTHIANTVQVLYFIRTMAFSTNTVKQFRYFQTVRRVPMRPIRDAWLSTNDGTRCNPTATPVSQCLRWFRFQEFPAPCAIVLITRAGQTMVRIFRGILQSHGDQYWVEVCGKIVHLALDYRSHTHTQTHAYTDFYVALRHCARRCDVQSDFV